MVGSDTLSHTLSVSHYLLTKTLRARVRVLRTRSCGCSTRLITTKSLERRRRIILRCPRTSKASLPAEEADNQMKMETSSATRFSTFRNPPFHTPPRLSDRKKNYGVDSIEGKKCIAFKESRRKWARMACLSWLFATSNSCYVVYDCDPVVCSTA